MILHYMAKKTFKKRAIEKGSKDKRAINIVVTLLKREIMYI